MGTKVRSLVTGAGGFIGHHLVSFLRAQGYWVRGVDLKRPEFCASDANEFELLDLRKWEECVRATAEIDEVYALAADTSEIGSSPSDRAQILHDNRLINLHCVEAARQNRVARFLYTSATCIYPQHWHSLTNCVPREEDKEDAGPAAHSHQDGWANLMTERLCIRYRREHGLETRIVRLDDVFGPVGPWYGGREKAPTELCRKIAAARLEGLEEIEISGDSDQKGSFCYIDNCVRGLHEVMRSDCPEPLTLGRDRMVSISELADIIASIAGVRLRKTYVHGSQRVRGRDPDKTRLIETLRWKPQISLEEGLRRTYVWVEKEVRAVASEYSFGVATFPVRPGKKKSRLSLVVNQRA